MIVKYNCLFGYNADLLYTQGGKIKLLHLNILFKFFPIGVYEIVIFEIPVSLWMECRPLYKVVKLTNFSHVA